MITSIATEPGYTIVENAPLTARNTFRVAARAELLLDVHDTAVLPELFRQGALKTGPVFVLGEGSNILLTRDWSGVVLCLAARGIRVLQDRGDAALVRAEAGENWNEFVHWSLARGFAGLENLVLIPGTVGAAPIQNIGAYGVEVREFVATVEAFDRGEGRLVRLPNAECAFSYRNSLFKHEADRYLVTAVEFLLPRQRELSLDYAGIREELTAMGLEQPSHAATADAVMRLRTRKLPNPALIGNAGSFFKNPVVAAPTAQALLGDHPGLPNWPAGEQRKLSAAWLIETCGFKGLREGDAGVSSQHSLVLVNYGKATGAQIWALAQRIIEAVRERFGVTLEPEPRVI